jgi:shikimate dehydrogenase
MRAHRRAAVLGSPIRHSLSPALHAAAYRVLGLDWAYTAIEVGEDGLAAFLDDLDDSWAGLSLTMPLKRTVLPLLDRADDVVPATGSCNTVVLVDGARHGHNTDVQGTVAAVREASGVVPRTGAVLGGGATAASAVVALAELGAADVVLLVRDPGRAGEAAGAARRAGLAVEVQPLTEASVAAAVAVADVTVSTLPPGAGDRWAAAVGRAAPRGVLLDVVYEPWPTASAAAWSAGGGRTVPGEAMLLHQAAAQVRLMTGLEPPVEAMRAGMAAERRRRRVRRPG